MLCMLRGGAATQTPVGWSPSAASTQPDRSPGDRRCSDARPAGRAVHAVHAVHAAQHARRRPAPTYALEAPALLAEALLAAVDYHGGSAALRVQGWSAGLKRRPAGHQGLGSLCQVRPRLRPPTVVQAGNGRKTGRRQTLRPGSHAVLAADAVAAVIACGTGGGRRAAARALSCRTGGGTAAAHQRTLGVCSQGGRQAGRQAQPPVQALHCDPAVPASRLREPWRQARRAKQRAINPN